MKRYDFQVCDEYAGKCEPMEESPNGEWVLYEDIKSLVADSEMLDWISLHLYETQEIIKKFHRGNIKKRFFILAVREAMEKED